MEDLLRHAQAGRIRVPTFQRAFKWGRDDVEKLIDSIWRGYPIGTLLLWAKAGPAGSVALGDLTFEVNEQGSAWFVVDGQQRIVSLVSTLLSKANRPEKFDLYFDLAKGVVTHARRGPVPATHLPLNRVVDSEDLLAWLDENRSALNSEWIRLAARVGKLVREYEIPAYVVTADDERIVRDIFERSNSSGKPLVANEVFNALHAPLDRQPAASLKDVVERLRLRSIGDIEEVHILRSLLAIEGKDVSGDLQRQLGGVDILAAVSRVELAMDHVLGFLAQDAGVPHLRLLPYKSPLTVLSVFFNRFPRPSGRARRLLTRWLWRGAATEELRGDGKGMRPALEAVRFATSGEMAAVGILSTVSPHRPVRVASESFNFRHARSRISAIALAELRPLHLQTADPIDVASLLNSVGEAFPQIAHKSASTPIAKAPVFSSVGNRLLHPEIADTSFLSALEASVAPRVLASHAITSEAMRSLRSDDRVAFLEARTARIEETTSKLIDGHAEWEHTDRPSIASMTDEDN